MSSLSNMFDKPTYFILPRFARFAQNRGKIKYEEYPDILSAGEASEALRVGENALYRRLNSGKLKAYKNGRNWLIPKEAMRQFVKEQAKLM